MKIHRRLLTALLAVIFLSLPLRAASAQAKVTIRWWHIDTASVAQAFAQAQADAFVRQHPNVTFEITVLEYDAFRQALTTAMQAGDPPDLFTNWGDSNLWSFADAGLLRDITPELIANNNEWKDSFAAQAALDAFKAGSKYYGVPFNWGGVGFWYNKDLFAKAGIKATPRTWDEFLEDVKTLKAAGITPITLGEQDRWPGSFWWVYLAVRTGGQKAFEAAYRRTGTFADPPFVRAGELLKQLVDLKPFPDGYLNMNYSQQEALMGEGQAAMDLMGQWSPTIQASSAADSIGFPNKLGWFPFPMVTGGGGDPTLLMFLRYRGIPVPMVTSGGGDPNDMMGGGVGFGVGKNARDEAVEFLRFFTSVEVQKANVSTGILPVVKGAEEAVTDPLQQLVLQGRNNAKYYQVYYDQFLPPAIAQALMDASLNLLAGASTPEEAAKAIEAVAATELKSR